MRPILLVITAILGITAPLQAQTYLITASGTISAAGGSFSSVPLGTAFTLDETFNSATATLTSSSSTSATYADPDGSSSFSFDGFNFSGSGPEVTITSNVPDTTPPDGIYIYGYEFSQPLPNNEGYAAQLLSTDSSVAPSTSLDSLQTFPVSDFFSGIGNLTVFNGGANIVDGVTTSFSVQEEAVPEPSSLVLVLLALPVLCWFRRRGWTKRVAA